MDGWQPVKGEVLSADEALKKYEEIVNSQRDPALLEYAGAALCRRAFSLSHPRENGASS